MGDCRIRIVIAKELLEDDMLKDKKADDKTSRIETAISLSIIHLYSADTTIIEVVEDIPELKMLYENSMMMNNNNNDNNKFKLWDCTLNPPRDISTWPIVEYPDKQGIKSITLHSAGCFPSGTWVVVSETASPSHILATQYDDAQYNKQENLTQKSTEATATQVRLVNKAKDDTNASSASSSSVPLPSQVLNSVAKRFDGTEDQKYDAEKSVQVRKLNHQEQQAKEEARNRKLDERISKLEEITSDKNQKVSTQVRRMLIKSRASGEKRLKMQDRLYFEMLVDDGESVKKEYRYFSPQDTISKIANTFFQSNDDGTKNSEILIRIQTVGSASYGRLPYTMRLYEAITGKFIVGEFDTLILRWYKDGDDPTPSVVEMQPTTDGDGEKVVLKEENTTDDKSNPVQESSAFSSEYIEDGALAAAIVALDEAKQKGKKAKKNTAAALKVRQMQMKSKAKGDAKRIKKMEDRFFLEVLVAESKEKISSLLTFSARTDKISRLVESVGISSDVDILVPLGEGSRFRLVHDTSISFNEAESSGVIECYGRIVVRPKG